MQVSTKSDAAGHLPLAAIIGISAGSFGAGVFSTVPTVLLLYYCTEILTIGPAVAAAIVFIPKAWAIVWDPVVGNLSDGIRPPGRRRTPFILAGAIGVALTFALLFNAPGGSSATTIIYVALMYFAMASAYSVFAVPYLAIPAEISSIAAVRERLMVWRMGFAMTGVLTGAGIAPHLVAMTGGGRQGYGVMALIVAASCGVAMLVTYFTVHRHHVRDQHTAASDKDVRRTLAMVVGNREYVRLWFAYLLAMSGASMLLAMVPYFVTYILGNSESVAGTMLLILFAGTVVALPFWSRLLRAWGGWQAFAIAVVAYMALTGGFMLVPSSVDIMHVAILFLTLGVPFAGLQLLPFTLLAHIAHASAEDGERVEGVYTGIWTAGEKLALAIGPAAAALGLAVFGFVSGAAEQSADTLGGLQTVMSVGPAVFLLPCLVILATRTSAASR